MEENIVNYFVLKKTHNGIMWTSSYLVNRGVRGEVMSMEIQQDHEVRIRVLEQDNTTTKGIVQTLCKTMDKIEGNTTWILRLIIAFMLGALWKLISI